MRLMLCQMSYGQVGSDNVIFPIPVLSGGTIDNQRNGLETQTKALMTYVIRPDTHFFWNPVTSL